MLVTENAMLNQKLENEKTNNESALLDENINTELIVDDCVDEELKSIEEISELDIEVMLINECNLDETKITIVVVEDETTEEIVEDVHEEVATEEKAVDVHEYMATEEIVEDVHEDRVTEEKEGDVLEEVVTEEKVIETDTVTVDVDETINTINDLQVGYSLNADDLIEGKVQTNIFKRYFIGLSDEFKSVYLMKGDFRARDQNVSILLTFYFGWLGIHLFRVGKKKLGVIKIIVLLLCSTNFFALLYIIWYLADILFAFMGRFNKYSGE